MSATAARSGGDRSTTRAPGAGSHGLPLALLLTSVAAVLASPSAGSAEPGPLPPAPLDLPLPELRAIAQRALPSVVAIRTTPLPPPPAPPEGVLARLWSFLGSAEQPAWEPGPAPGFGSGFIVDPAGWILTSAHLVQRARFVTIEFAPRLGLPPVQAQVRGLDPTSDVALLEARLPAPLPALPLGRSAGLAPGQWVLGIGCPLGLGHSVAAGVVGAVGRRRLAGQGARTLPAELIQLDVTFNPGNSGGPVLDLDGAVVGVATAVHVAGQGLAFATPIDLVVPILHELRTEGAVARPWLGVQVQSLDGLLAASYGLPEAIGALVTRVMPGSPALLAGLREQDVILRLADQPVGDADELQGLLARAPLDLEQTVTIWRDQATQALSLRLVARATRPASALEPASTLAAPGLMATWGLAVTDLDGALLVADVVAASPAALAGFERGDLLLALDDRPVRTRPELLRRLDEQPPGTLLRFATSRAERRWYRALQVPR